MPQEKTEKTAQEPKDAFLSCYRQGLELIVSKSCPVVIEKCLVSTKSQDQQILNEIWNNNIFDDPIFLSGPSGSGKTIAVQNLVLNELEKGNAAFWFPVRRWNDHQTGFLKFGSMAILETATPALRRRRTHSSYELVEEIIQSVLSDYSDSVIVVIDGINELTSRHAIHELRTFITEFYWHKFILTGRVLQPDLMADLGLQLVEHIQVSPLNFESIHWVVERFPGLSAEQRTQFLRSLSLHEDALFLANSPNTLMNQLHLFLRNGSTPRSIGELFDRLSLMLYTTSGGLDRSIWLRAVASLAAEMNICSILTLTPAHSNFLGQLWKNLDEQLPVFNAWRKGCVTPTHISLANCCNIFAFLNDGSIEFLHQSWQDFLAGYWLATNWLLLSQADKQALIDNPAWKDSFTFSVHFMNAKPEQVDLFRTLGTGDATVLQMSQYLREANELSEGIVRAARESLIDCFVCGDVGPRRVEAFEQLVDLQDVLDCHNELIEGCKLLSTDTYWLLRESAARVLGELNDRSKIQILLNLLDDDVFWVRAASAWALGAIGAVEALDQLMACSRIDPDSFVRRWATWAIDWILNSRFKDSGPQWYENMYRTNTFGPSEGYNIDEYYINCLKDQDPWIRSAGVEAIGDMELRHARDLLKSLANDPSVYVRAWVMRAYAKLGGSTAVQILDKGLEDESSWVRMWALSGVIYLRPIALKERVKSLLTSVDPDIAKTANLAFAVLSKESMIKWHVWDIGLDRDWSDICKRMSDSMEAISHLYSPAIFKRTKQLGASFPMLFVLVRNFKDFLAFINVCYQIFYEGAGKDKLRYPKKLIASDDFFLWDVKLLRNCYFHDLEHGSDRDIERKISHLRRIQRKYGLSKEKLNATDFAGAQWHILTRIEQCLKVMEKLSGGS